jgi:hypothetical protein
VKRSRSALWLGVVVAAALATQACATAVPAARVDSPNGDAETESYRQGICDALAKLQRTGGLPVVASVRPPEVLHYVGPVMQELWVPAQVVGGLVIPAHRQWVVIRPGIWHSPQRPPRSEAEHDGPQRQIRPSTSSPRRMPRTRT